MCILVMLELDELALITDSGEHVNVRFEVVVWSIQIN